MKISDTGNAAGVRPERRERISKIQEKNRDDAQTSESRKSEKDQARNNEALRREQLALENDAKNVGRNINRAA